MRQATTGPYFVDSSNSGSAPPPKMVRWHRILQVLGRGQSQSQNEPETPRPGPSRLDSHQHSYVNATFSQRGFIRYPVLNTPLLNMAPSSCQLSSVHGNVEKGRSHMLPLLPGSPFEMRRSRPARMSIRFQEQVTPADIHRCSMTIATSSQTCFGMSLLYGSLST